MAFSPVIIGVADVKNKTSDHREPAILMLEAISKAIEDTGALPQDLKSHIDSIDIVRTWTWPYADLPGLVSKRLGLESRPKWTRYTETHGGNQPVKLVDEAAGRIARGEASVAVVTGGEALASCEIDLQSFPATEAAHTQLKYVTNCCFPHVQVSACAKAGNPEPAGWTQPETPVQEVFSPSTADLGQDLGGMHSIGAPIHVYPLYENAFRAHRQQSLRENNDESAALYAGFAKVAAQNQYSWNYGKSPASEDEIGSVSKKNRMICTPYPLLMNAFNTVNLAAAVIVTSVEMATKLGVPKERWVYPLGGAGKKEKERFWERPNFHHSEAISVALDGCLEASGLKIDNIDALDLYSCFPIVPKLACHHLGLPIIDSPKPLTLLGGLTSFGGAGNNYSMHAITEMTRQIREGRFQKGLILANGGVLSYQHAICLSSNGRAKGSSYPDSRAGSEATTEGLAPVVDAFAEGEAIVETYTVEFSRDGSPETAFIVGRLKHSGHRFIANHGDQRTLQHLSSALEEQVGTEGFVRTVRTKSGEPESNVFYLGPRPSL